MIVDNCFYKECITMTYESIVEVKLMEILVENMSWIFSGVGVFILGGIFIRNSNKKKAGRKSITVIIDNDEKKLEISVQNKVPNCNSEGK